MFNREIAEFHLQHRNKSDLVRFISGKARLTASVIKHDVELWIKKFDYYWSKSRTEERFYKMSSTKWLDSSFGVS